MLYSSTSSLQKIQDEASLGLVLVGAIVKKAISASSCAATNNVRNVTRRSGGDVIEKDKPVSESSFKLVHNNNIITMLHDDAFLSVAFSTRRRGLIDELAIILTTKKTIKR
jgi:hypothetical protein